jgi:hypothetical protein
MENKDKDQAFSQSNINNSVNNYGVNNGNMGHSININVPQPQVGDAPPPDAVETAIWKGNVVKLVGEGRTEEALAEILKTRPPEATRNQVVLLAGRFSEIKIEKIAGILDKEVEFRELNRIRESILTIISRI